ncbi:hypothetical protein LWI29_004178 [Acer saccharum]|uniref:Orn/Lys/Arg decarboxylases family 1 pyridoxal-P attachment site domain-containing protein n=1 Tax=Acer saccharum TaxID=4024 RepID=A0AA39SWB6_ACESA|nr:hypothetical protein LWI29_004178 [Acer saccharum]
MKFRNSKSNFKMSWYLEEEISRIIKIGVALGLDFDNKEVGMVDVFVEAKRKLKLGGLRELKVHKLSEISEVCHNHGIPLIVDEAHGAHFGFSDQLPYSALQQGADLVVQSTHKVLCSLTQSSMLHLSTKTSVDRERISMCLQSLQTTSPNNLLLASLDAARAQLNENPKTVFNEAINLATETRYLLKNIPGISVLDSSSFPNFQTRDPLRLTLGFWQLGLSGYQANDILHKDLMVICELVGSRSLTFAFNLGTCREQIQRLVSAIQQVSPIHSSLSNGKFVNGLVADENSVMGPSADIEIGLNPREC